MNTEQSPAGPRATGLLCPECRVDLLMTERKNVEIDYCPTCRGVWLERGELDKIIEHSAAELKSVRMMEPISDQTRSSSHGGHRQRGYDDHGIGRKRKSWLQELFD